MSRKRGLILGFLILVIVLLWFAGVDKSWFVEDCRGCGYSADILQYRVFTFPLYEIRRDYYSLPAEITSDLGTPCPHNNKVRWHKHRYWGLLYCASPCINGIYRISGGETWYTQEIKSEVIAMGKENPGLGKEFYRRVIIERDNQYWDQFVKELRGFSTTQNAVSQ